MLLSEMPGKVQEFNEDWREAALNGLEPGVHLLAAITRTHRCHSFCCALLR